MLRNFDDVVTKPELTQGAEIDVCVTAEVVPTSSLQEVGLGTRSHLYASGEWGWEELRDYVIAELETRFGTFPRDPLKESGIFKGFIARWGAEKAESIARTAFEVHGGWWRSAPVSVTRFAKNCDPYFADVIALTL